MYTFRQDGEQIVLRETIAFTGSWWPQEQQVIEQGLVGIWEEYPGITITCHNGLTGEPFEARVKYQEFDIITTAYGLNDFIQCIKSCLPVIR